MDTTFTIKPRPGVHKYSPRDPVPVRETTDTGLDAIKAASAPSDGSGGNNPEQREPRHNDHAPHDVVANPESRDVIYRENDVRTAADGREHPDQALQRFRAYRPALTETEGAVAPEPHANIKA